MRAIEAVTSEGPRGPAYIRFSQGTVARTETWQDNDDLVIDYDADHAVVGVELISLGPDVMEALVDAARRNGLDLSALVAHSFSVFPAA